MTPRLQLRRWSLADLDPFAQLNQDPQVMAHMPARLTRAASDAMADRIMAHFQVYGFGLWAVEIPGVTSFAGFIGLSIPTFEAAFTPSVEVGWRLAVDYWGQGYATEGARAALFFGFEVLELDEIVSFTVPANHRSWRVMERIGMHHHPADDFGHPLLATDHPLHAHVFYRLQRSAFQAQSDVTPTLK